MLNRALFQLNEFNLAHLRCTILNPRRIRLDNQVRRHKDIVSRCRYRRPDTWRVRTGGKHLKGIKIKASGSNVYIFRAKSETKIESRVRIRTGWFNYSRKWKFKRARHVLIGVAGLNYDDKARDLWNGIMSAPLYTRSFRDNWRDMQSP